jgi:hypothetical protein
MRISRILCAMLTVSAICAATAQANWMTFTGSGVTSVGTWPGGSALSGAAVVTASGFVNGIPSTPFIGLTPITINNLSPDYFATALQPNPGPVVTMIGTPYNDTGDKYHVVVDFTATTGGANPGTLPAGSTFAIIDLDILENYRNVKATDAANNPITTPWISGPNAFFDMTNPMTVNPAVAFGSSPTLTSAAGVYQMFGVNWNDDSEMWLFKTTQDVKTIAFDMEVGTTTINQGGGGAGWAFYTGPKVPEPTAITLMFVGLVFGGCSLRRGRCC